MRAGRAKQGQKPAEPGPARKRSCWSTGPTKTTMSTKIFVFFGAKFVGHGRPGLFDTAGSAVGTQPARLVWFAQVPLDLPGEVPEKSANSG
jgi:hypothetical protein